MRNDANVFPNIPSLLHCPVKSSKSHSPSYISCFQSETPTTSVPKLVATTSVPDLFLGICQPPAPIASPQSRDSTRYHTTWTPAIYLYLVAPTVLNATSLRIYNTTLRTRIRTSTTLVRVHLPWTGLDWCTGTFAHSSGWETDRIGFASGSGSVSASDREEGRQASTQEHLRLAWYLISPQLLCVLVSLLVSRL
jgi:hypothetical protein